MASEVLLVKQGFLKCPPFDKEMSFHERWPRYWCAVVAHSSPAGQSHYFLYFFNQQPRNIKQILAEIPAVADGKTNTPVTTHAPKLSAPLVADESILLALPLRDCYYLRRCHQHSLYKNLFSICFSHASYFLAPDTGSNMESWIMTFCEHLDINCEEDQQPRLKNGRMQQYSLSNFRHSSIKQRFQSGSKASRRPNTLPFPPPTASQSSSHATGPAAALAPLTAMPAFTNTPAAGAYSSPSIGSLDSSCSLGTAFSSDTSMPSTRTAATMMSAASAAAARLPLRRPSVASKTVQSDDEDELCRSVDALGLKEQTPYRHAASRLQSQTRALSQDSLSQVDSGVSYDRESTTPSSALHPDGADIVSTDTSTDLTADSYAFSRASPGSDQTANTSTTTLSNLSSGQPTVLKSAGSSTCTISSLMSESPFLANSSSSSASSSRVCSGAMAMPHRTPAILSGSIPQMPSRSSYYDVSHTPAFSYGTVPVDMSSGSGSGAAGRVQRTASLGRDAYKHYAYQKSAADHKASSARASLSFAKPNDRSMLSVKLTVKLQRSLTMEHLLLVDAFNYVWVAGWNSLHHPRVFHIGDRVLSINGKPCTKASSAMTDVQSSGLEVEIVLVRTPLGNEVSVRRHSTSEILGLGLRKNTITHIYPNTAASRSGINLQALGMSGKPVPWVVTQINSVPVNMFNADRDKVMEQLNMSGFFVTLLLQPKDFISALKRKVRSSPHCKQFMQVPASIADVQSRTQAMRYNQPIILHLSKSRPTLGITVKGGADMPQHYITIDDVDQSGIAHSDGFLKKGMEILAVDGISLVGLAHCEAVQLIRKCFASNHQYLELVVKSPSK